MAWNEPGGDNQNPWGKGKNQGPPDLDEAFKKLQQSLNNIFGKSGSNKNCNSSKTGNAGFFMLVVIILFAVYFIKAVYTVDEKERAVVLRFGQYVETVKPGLHIYFPPFETKYQEKVTELRTYNLRQQMLTEDENIVEVSMSVQYNINDVKSYVLNVAKPLISLEEASQSALRHVVGSSIMHQVLTEGRETMGVEVKKRLQDYQNRYKTGLNINKVNIESAQPPKEVQTAFDDVIRAREDEQRSKNQADAYSNKVIPEARGKAKRLMEESNAYKDELIARAQGEANRFTKLFSEYQKQPDVTRERLYIETMEQVLGDTTKVLINSKNNNNMMYLPLDKLNQMHSSTSDNQVNKAMKLNQKDLKEITNQVTEELNRRMSHLRNNTNKGGYR